MLILLLRVFFEFAFNMKYLGASLYCQQRTAVFALLNISSLTYAEIFMSLLKMPCVNWERNTAVVLSVLKPLETILNQPLYVNNPLWGLWNVNLTILIWVFTWKIFIVIAGGAVLHLHTCADVLSWQSPFLFLLFF